MDTRDRIATRRSDLLTLPSDNEYGYDISEEHRPEPAFKTGDLVRWGRRPGLLFVVVDRDRWYNNEYTWGEIYALAGMDSEEAKARDDRSLNPLIYAGWDIEFGGNIYTSTGVCFCESEYCLAGLVDGGKAALHTERGWPYWTWEPS